MKAIALVSGGLDSILAARVIKEQGIEVMPLHFKIPFCPREKEKSPEKKSVSDLTADILGQKLRIIDISKDFLKLLESPMHGFGSHMNPCVDCKILMLGKAKDLMKGWDSSFIITGEVLGQRPMSQHKQALQIIEKKSGLEGLVLRPLSAKLLSETIPEKQAQVDRNKLLRFSGRSRKPQMALAKILNIKEYNQPAGGCLLTDPQFAKRLKDLIMHKELNLDNVELLKIGRHFRISAHAKLIVGRNEKENEQLINLAKDKDYLFMPTDEIAGPTSLGRGIFNDVLVRASCSIACRYCDLNGRTEVDLIYCYRNKKEILRISPLTEDSLKSLRI